MVIRIDGQIAVASIAMAVTRTVRMPMGNQESSNPAANAPNRKIALGLEDYLDAFARANSAESWKQFATTDPMEWKAHFLEVMNDPHVEILFDLKGVDVWGGVTRASRGAGGATDWELLQIMQNEDWWPRIRWIKDGVQVPNPFDGGSPDALLP